MTKTPLVIISAVAAWVKVTEYNVDGVYNTNYGYDLQGNLTSVTDAANNVTSMTYDLLGRKTAMTDPDMGSWQYQYDSVGNLTGQRDGRTQWLYLEYDDLNRLIRKRRDTAATGPKVAEYLYDATGQKGLLDKSLAYDSAGATVLVESDPVTYDNRNRLTQQRWVVAGTGGGTFRMDYAYNEADQRTSLTYPLDNAGAQGEAVSYTYNSVGQLTGASGSGVSYIASATYNAQGQLTQMVNDVTPNGLTRQWSYETNTLRLSILQAGKNAAFDDRQKLTYGYDNNGNVTSLTDTINAGQKQCFQYDYLNRLMAAFSGNAGCTAYSAVGTGAYNMSYGYDAIGNMTTKDGTPMTYGDAAHKHAVTAAFGNTYSYDGNGNQTSRTIGGTVSTFTYDYENRLTAISGGATASFVYDADGNRVKSTVGSVITVYIAGVFEFIEAGTTDKMTKYYEGNALRRSGYGVDDGVFYTLRDHLNSSSVIMNQSGTVVTNGNQYYLPYGNNRGSAFSGVTTKRFTGQYHENGLTQDEGLSYYNARWYDAKLGRFLSADTIVPQPTNPQAFNRYSYVINNPLKYVDPTGHTFAMIDPGPGGGGRPRPTNIYLPIVTNQRPRPAAGSACPGSILCVPPTPTAFPTPAPALAWAAPTRAARFLPGPTWTPTAPPLIGPTPRPTATTAPTQLGSPEWSGMFYGFAAPIVEQAIEDLGWPTAIRAGSRAIGSLPIPITMAGGYVVSLAPNVYQNISNEGWSSFTGENLYVDLVTDTVGFATTTVIGWGTGVAFGTVTIPTVVGVIPAAVVGDLAGSTTASVVWDVWVGPTFARPYIRDLMFGD
jgi:RHS repeat-associated protein